MLTINKVCKYTNYHILQYLNIKDFVKMGYLNKYYNNILFDYIKFKKRTFKFNKTKKTIHNSLYRLVDNNYTPKQTRIIKIIKCVKDFREPIKITYLVISKMGCIGRDNNKRYCIYPNWSNIETLEDENFIPFY